MIPCYAMFIFCIWKMLSEWGLWNNSWVKNLPVRPLAPRRKTPGQLYPAFRPPGLGQKFCITEFIVKKRVGKPNTTIILRFRQCNKTKIKISMLVSNLQNLKYHAIQTRAMQASSLSTTQLLHQGEIRWIPTTCPACPHAILSIIHCKLLPWSDCQKGLATWADLSTAMANRDVLQPDDWCYP